MRSGDGATPSTTVAAATAAAAFTADESRISDGTILYVAAAVANVSQWRTSHAIETRRTAAAAAAASLPPPARVRVTATTTATTFGTAARGK